MSRLVRSAATPGYDAYGTVLCEPHDGAAVAWLPVEEHATTPTRHVSAAALRQRRSGGAMADPRVGDRTRGDPVRPTWPDRRSRGRAAGDLVRRDGRERQLVASVLAIDLDLGRVGELARVTVGRPVEQRDGGAGGDDHATEGRRVP